MLDCNLLKYFTLYDQLQYYQKKLDIYRHSNPEKFNKYKAKHLQCKERLTMYHKLLFGIPIREESNEFSMTYEAEHEKNKAGESWMNQ